MFPFKKFFAALLLISLLIPLVSCYDTDEYQSRTVFAMNTVIEINISADKDVSELLLECENIIYEIENTVSKTKPDSDVYKLNSNSSAVCNSTTLDIINKALSVSNTTDFAFDITLEPIIELWNSIDGQETLPDELELCELLENTGVGKVTVESDLVSLGDGTRIDLGGIAKGYAAQKVVDYIKENTDEYGVHGGIVSFGGAVSTFGRKQTGTDYKIAVRDPINTSESIGYISLKNDTHISVSGDYERYVTVGDTKYHHIIDRKTGYPAQSGIKSVAVVCEDGTLCDALSTALFVMGYEKSSKLYEKNIFEFEAVFVLSDGSIKTTPNVNFTKYAK